MTIRIGLNGEHFYHTPLMPYEEPASHRIIAEG
jgi:hypothetical protein